MKGQVGGFQNPGLCSASVSFLALPLPVFPLFGSRTIFRADKKPKILFLWLSLHPQPHRNASYAGYIKPLQIATQISSPCANSSVTKDKRERTNTSALFDGSKPCVLLWKLLIVDLLLAYRKSLPSRSIKYAPFRLFAVNSNLPENIAHNMESGSFLRVCSVVS